MFTLSTSANFKSFVSVYTLLKAIFLFVFVIIFERMSQMLELEIEQTAQGDSVSAGVPF